MSRDCKDILQTKVTCINANNGMFGGVYQQTDISVLDCISRLPEQFKHNIDIVRSYEYHSQEQKEAKVRLIPTFILSGTYPYKKICDKDIQTKDLIKLIGTYDKKYINNPNEELLFKFIQ